MANVVHILVIILEFFFSFDSSLFSRHFRFNNLHRRYWCFKFHHPLMSPFALPIVCFLGTPCRSFCRFIVFGLYKRLLFGFCRSTFTFVPCLCLIFSSMPSFFPFSFLSVFLFAQSSLAPLLLFSPTFSTLFLRAFVQFTSSLHNWITTLNHYLTLATNRQELNTRLSGDAFFSLRLDNQSCCSLISVASLLGFFITPFP